MSHAPNSRTNAWSAAPYVSRLIGVAAAGAAIAATLYKAPQWLARLEPGAAIALVAVGLVSGLAIGAVALRANRSTARRLALEIVALGTMLLTAELVLMAANPAAIAASATEQRILERERKAHTYGLDFDERTTTQVAANLRSSGVEALPGVAQGMASVPSVRRQLPAGFYPLAHASGVTVVECNEGLGFLQFRSDEFGFNNPRGLVASGQIDIAVVGASLALGHCVPTDMGAVALVRKRYPRTANFGIAGARVLSQLAIFREYVEPLRPRTVFWLVNPSFAEPKEEADEHRLVRYLDPGFRQQLMQRQDEVDEAIREVIAPVQAQADAAARSRPAPSSIDLMKRAVTLPEVRRVLNLTGRWHEPGPPPDLVVFEQALDLVSTAVDDWNGRLVVMILPSYGDTLGFAPSRARHDALAAVLRERGIESIDGAALFRGQNDPLDLYTLRIDNHPNERGHALLAGAMIAAIEEGGRQ